MFCYFWDIETSKIITDSKEKMQVTYLTNVLKLDYINYEIVDSKFFRTISESIEYFNTLEECTVFAHNLDYELAFLLRELGDVNGTIKHNKLNNVQYGIYEEQLQNNILRDKHSPLSINLDKLPHITFRDSYAIFNKGVAQLGKELNLKKLEYDYDKIRLPWDKLEQLDYDYNERDNVIVAYSIIKLMKDNNLKFEEIPLTFTSFVKRKRKEFILENFGKKGINKFNFDRNEQLNNFEFFELMLKVYQGGLTCSNINETGKFIEKGVYSIDIKSSYPYQLCTRHFPFYSEKNSEYYFGELANDVFHSKMYKGFLGYFKFKNIRVKNRNYLLPISSSQISKGSISTDRVLFNGKLLSCSELEIPANEVDIKTINLVYKYDEVECISIFTTNKTRRLRVEEICFLLNAFNKKEIIGLNKDHATEEELLEYSLSKQYINGMYGVKVTIPIKTSFSIDKGEINAINYYDYNETNRQEIHNNFINNQPKFGNNIDIFTDGIYTTSYARYMLVEKMVTLVDKGCNVIYADTDSLKFYLNTMTELQLTKYLTIENEKIIEENKNNPRFLYYKNFFDISDTEFNLISNLGIWEIETVDENNNIKPIPLFVTYGAKKYGYVKSDNSVVTTIAGCNKKNPPICIKNLAQKQKISIKESFKMVLALGTQFDVTSSGRTTAFAEKRPRENMELQSYNGIQINQYGGTIIENTTYTLNITLNDSKLLGVKKADDILLKINIKGDVYFD